MDDEQNLKEFEKYLLELAKSHDLKTLWYDFLLWSAVQAGYPHEQHYADQVTEKYPDEVIWRFSYLYNKFAAIVKTDPHQNFLLKVMCQLGLADKYLYNESIAERMLLEKAKQINPHSQRLFHTRKHSEALNDFEKMSLMMAISTFSIKDENCASNYGSFLIAMANVIRAMYPINYQERAILIAACDGEKTAALISFIQFSLMGIAGYVQIDNKFTFSASFNINYFAPPGSICSPSFYLDGWNDSRMITMNTIMSYGVPEAITEEDKANKQPL